MTKEELWQAVLGEIELNISKANFVTWFRNTAVVSKKNNLVTITVPNGFTKEWLENKYNKLILKALKNISPDIRSVEYVINQTLYMSDEKNLKKKRWVQQSKDLIIEETLRDQLPFETYKIDKETNLNPRYTFTSFIVGSSNELAHAAASAIVKKPGVTYNPLFIYGGVGLGKTHLLQAIGNEIIKKHPKKKVIYLTSEKFTSELISSIHEKRIAEFKEKYRQFDVLIIDDIQFLAGKEKTQEEFFHTFNSLYEREKQIILSSDRPPKSIATLEERLRSRFEGGMIADIGYPDLETRIAILKSKNFHQKIKLSDEIFEYIATNIQKNIRELEGALNRLTIYANKEKESSLEIKEVKKILNPLLFSTKPKIKNYKSIIKTVSQFYEIEEKDLYEKNRKKEISHPRQIIMYLMRTELSCSFPFIGSKLGGRDHTTVIHACNKIEASLKQDEGLIEEINLIKDHFVNTL